MWALQEEWLSMLEQHIKSCDFNKSHSVRMDEAKQPCTWFAEARVIFLHVISFYAAEAAGS